MNRDASGRGVFDEAFAAPPELAARRDSHWRRRPGGGRQNSGSLRMYGLSAREPSVAYAYCFSLSRGAPGAKLINPLRRQLTRPPARLDDRGGRYSLRLRQGCCRLDPPWTR